MSNRDFLNDKVFPYLDAVKAGFLSDLDPHGPGSNGAYTLNCPECGHKHRAYYFPGAPIVCNRINSCPEGRAGISIWSFLKNQGYSQSEIFQKLCDAVGVKPESDGAYTPSAGAIFQSITRKAFKPSDSEITNFLKDRNLKVDDIARMDLGYYPSSEYLQKALTNEGVSITEARDLGYISTGNPEAENNCSQMRGRVIGYWEQANGNLGYWGYLKSGSPKYLFSSGLDKTKPYRFYSAHRVNIVEGTIDRDSCAIAGIRVMAIGGAQLNKAQAEYLAKNGVKEVNHIIDTDAAGLRGGLKTITNALNAGLTPFITFLGYCTDDPDNLRKLGKYEMLKSAIDKPLPGDLFAAMVHSKSLAESPVFDLRYDLALARSSWPKQFAESYDNACSLTDMTVDPVVQGLNSITEAVVFDKIPKKNLLIQLEDLISRLKNG